MYFEIQAETFNGFHDGSTKLRKIGFGEYKFYPVFYLTKSTIYFCEYIKI